MFHSSGAKLLYSANPKMNIQDACLYCIDISTGETLRKLTLGDKVGFNWMALAADNSKIAIPATTGLIVVDLKSWSIIKTLAVIPNATCAIYSPDSEYLAASTSEQIFLLNASAHNNIIAFSSRTNSSSSLYGYTSLEFSRSSLLLATSSNDMTVIIWSTPELIQLRMFIGHTQRSNSFTFLTDNKLASQSFDNTIRVWDADTGDLKALIHECCVHFHTYLTSSPSGKTFASFGSYTRVNIFDSYTFECIRFFCLSGAKLNGVTYLDDNRLIATELLTSFYNIVSITTGEEVVMLFEEGLGLSCQPVVTNVDRTCNTLNLTHNRYLLCSTAPATCFREP